MFVKQLSVFVENREGRLDEVLEVLKNENINIVSLSLADTSDYGMLRLVVSDPEKGKTALKEKGFSAMLTDILVVKLAHQVGQLQKILAIICKQGINIEYMYALSTGTDDASIAMKCSDMIRAENLLSANSTVKLMSDKDIAGL
jgi:hypothetical protein